MTGWAYAEEPPGLNQPIKNPGAVFSLVYTDTPEPVRFELAEASQAAIKVDPQIVPIPGAFDLTRGLRPGGKTLFEANLILMIGLNAADYFSTREALKYPGLEESNPIMKPFVKSPAAFAAVKIGTTALSYIGFKALFKRNKTAAWILTTATNALLSYVVANNMRLIQRARAL